ncbi:hypothetical protein IID20_04055 [Patescibacteria group bacterium]|nr:hypothetical protein [Patescibacteria group bacterium]
MKKVPDKILFSKNKIINLGLLIVIFNPLPLGLIYGFFLWREVPTKNEGKLIMIFSFIWGAISLALFQEYFRL